MEATSEFAKSAVVAYLQELENNPVVSKRFGGVDLIERKNSDLMLVFKSTEDRDRWLQQMQLIREEKNHALKIPSSEVISFPYKGRVVLVIEPQTTLEGPSNEYLYRGMLVDPQEYLLERDHNEIEDTMVKVRGGVKKAM